jgi:hypothetical protein
MVPAVTASIAQGLSPTQLAVLQRVSDAVQPLQLQPQAGQAQQQQRAPQAPAVPPPNTGRGRLVDILV